MINYKTGLVITIGLFQKFFIIYLKQASLFINMHYSLANQKKKA